MGARTWVLSGLAALALAGAGLAENTPPATE